MAGMSSFPQHIPMPSESEINGFLGAPSQAGPAVDMPSSPEIDQWLETKGNEERFDNPLGMAASALTGAADSATLGLSNVAMTKSGLMDPKTLKALQDVNPISYGAGETAGMFAPSGAAGLIGKAGKATYRGIKALEFIKDAEKIGGISKGLVNIGAHAAGSAVEGAAFAGVGNSLNEMALGDPDLNAEKIMSNFGYGALYGGAIGGALKTAAIGAPPALTAAKDALSSVKNIIMGDGKGAESLISKGLGVMDSSGKLTDSFINRAKNLDVNQQEELVRGVTGGLNTVKNNLNTAMKDLNATLRPAERDALIETANGPKVKVATQDVIDSINKATEMMKLNSGEYSQNAVSKLERWRTQIANNLKAQDPESRFDLLKDFKQDMERWGKGFQSETKAETKKVIDGITAQVRDTLHNPDVFGMAGSSEAAHNELLKQVYDFIPPKIAEGSKARSPQQKEFQKLFLGTNGDFDPSKMKKFLKLSESPEGQRGRELLDGWFELQQKLPEHFENTYANVPNDLWDESKLSGVMDTLKKTKGDVGQAQTQYQDAIRNSKGKNLGLRELMLGGIGVSHPLLGAAGFAMDVAQRPVEYINKLAEIERMLGSSAKGIEKGAKSVFNPSLKSVGKMKGLLSKELSAPDIEAHKTIRDDLAQLNNNPSLLVDKLSNSTGHLLGVAPKMGEGLQASMIRANQFLQSKMPQGQNNSPFEPDPDPSPTEISQFHRYRQVVEDPMIAFDQIRAGTIGPETVETLQTVYPRVYEEMKAGLLKNITDRVAKKETVPYSLKQSISFFFGHPIDSSLSPRAILANQMAMQRQQQQQPQGEVKKSGAKDMTIASRTGVQRERDDA